MFSLETVDMIVQDLLTVSLLRILIFTLKYKLINLRVESHSNSTTHNKS